MRFLPFPSVFCFARHIRRPEWFAPLVVLLAIVNSSCENKHIGRPCDLAVPDAGIVSGGGTTTTIDVGLECPSRICLLPANESSTATTSLCTADCSSDDDCADGELRNADNPVGCAKGFVCKIAVTVGDFCCRRMCVCKDFLLSTTFKTPTVCMPTAINKAQCQNIH